uniref:FLYWCH-type domain-containing protein n=1 Tax=Anopheles epiroticus TaxID=199890 RepID=A0A182PAI4_9DIPT
MQLSVRDDHDANICANCVVSIEAFFKYKSMCVENDRLLRKKRDSFFAGLSLAADSGDTFQSAAHQRSKRRRLSRNDGGEGGTLESDQEEELTVDRKRNRAAGLPDEDGGIKKPHNGSGGSEEGEVEANHRKDLAPSYHIKQEVIESEGDGEDENRNERQQGEEEDEEEEYFNPNQFLAQETQIDEGDEIIEDGDNDVSSEGGADGHFVPNGAEEGAAIGQPFERGWRTTEFAPQPGSSGLKTLKITDYSNVTGKRGRPQRFVTEMLSMAAAAAAAAAAAGNGGGVNNLLPYHSGEAMYQQLQRLNGLTGPSRLPLTVGNSLQGSTTTRGLGGMIEPTKKVQKFLDDGLRELIYNAGAPNPHYSRDGGSTDFMVVKARFNSYNIIFDDNRFLRRNKSVSGLPKWYWACSVTGCPHAPDSGGGCSNALEQKNDPRRNYELRVANDGSEMLVYAAHTHGLIMTRKDGVRVYRCTSVVADETGRGGDAGRPCTDTVFLHTNGRIAKVCKEEQVDYDMELPMEGGGGGGDRYRQSAGEAEDDKRRRPQKIIVYEGYRYKYCHARPEGSFYWRCVLRHDKDCLASIQTKRNLEFLNVNDQPHNHDPPDPSEPHENAMLCEIRLPVKGEPTEGSTDFKLVKSGQKREFLIYKGYRYYFQYESKNGRRSYRCTMFKNCPAGAFLLPNSTIQEAKNFIHTHPPVEDMDKYITKDSLITSPIKLPTDGGGVDGAGKRGLETGDWKNGSIVGGTAGIEPLSKDPEVARRNGYRIIKNYKNKEIMIYLGWRYFEDYKKKSGGQVWRCSSHRLCRGSVHLFPDGSINFAKLVDHNHSPPKKIISHSSVDGGYTKALLDGSSLEQSLGMGADGTNDSLLAGGGTYHRYITHQGHRFRFATRKREGTIYWRCAMRLETKCPVSFHTKEDTYELVSTRNHEHNHPIPTVWPEVAGGQIDEPLPKVRLPAEEVGTTDFILTKNSKGRDLVLYRNGRFYLDYSRKDGKIVFRCSAVSGCRATVLLLPNKTLQVPEDFSHNHPTADGWEAGEATISPDGKPIAGLQLTEPIELKSDEEEDEEEKSNESMEERARSGVCGDGGGQESILPKIILYDGFQFRFISRHPTEQSAFFRCFNFDAKKNQCHASLYTDLNGVVIQTNQQPHNHEQGDYLMGPDKYRSHQQDQPTQPLQLNGNGTDLSGTRDYKIVKNWKNRDVLVFQNCRYFLHYVRKDGRKVWRCSAIRSCHAAVYLNADGTVDQFRGQHVHEIRPEGEPRRRRRRKKSELMPFGYAGVMGSGSAAGTIFANGMLANAAELMARGINGPAMLNGAGMSHHGPAAVNGSVNGGHNGSNEWIDYSDYGMQMSGGSPNDTAGRRADDDNQSLWQQFHPAEAGG